MSNIAAASLAALAVLALAGCAQTPPSAALDSAQEYFQRTDTVTLSAGNAKEVNTRLQEIDPWPRYVGNRNIPGNGERMVGAAQRYQDVSQQDKGPKPLPLVGATADTAAGGSTPSP